MIIRVLTVWFVAALGAAVGAWLGSLVGLPRRGAAIGVALALAAFIAVDSLPGKALMRWLSAPASAPRLKAQGTGAS